MDVTSVCTSYSVPGNPNWVQGGIISGIVYGGVTALSFFCLQLLWKNSGHSQRTLKNWTLIGYVSIMFILATMILASNINYISNIVVQGTAIVNSLGRLGDVCYVISNWGADALLIWRCIVIYEGCRFRRWIVAFIPVLLFLTSIATGILFLCFPGGTGNIIQSGAEYLNTADELDPVYVNIQFLYASITLSLNVVVTLMIISRLLLHRHRITRLLGKNHGKTYTGVIAMIIESQIVVVIAVLILVVLLFISGNDSSSTLMVYQIVAQVQIFAPLLIIFRVAQGKAWSSESFSTITTGGAKGPSNDKLTTLQFSSTTDNNRNEFVVTFYEGDEIKMGQETV